MANVLPFPVRVQVVKGLCEGTSIRATSRLTNVDKDVVMRLGVKVGEGCTKLHEALSRNIDAQYLEVDETWSYVGVQERRKEKKHPPQFGDQYTMFAIDRDTKFVPSHETGKRNLTTGTRFMKDLRERVDGKPQISVDGWPEWPESVRRAFGHRGADVGSTVKEYQKPCPPDGTRATCGRVKSQTRATVYGNPEKEMISTSTAERLNLTTRMQQRRFTRLTNAYSKKVENHTAATALHYFHYNFVRVHDSLGTTPAVAAGAADHPWTMEEMVEKDLGAEGAMNPPTFQKRPRRVPRKTHTQVNGPVAAPRAPAPSGGAAAWQAKVNAAQKEKK